MKKISRRQQKHEKLPSMQKVKRKVTVLLVINLKYENHFQSRITKNLKNLNELGRTHRLSMGIEKIIPLLLNSVIEL